MTDTEWADLAEMNPELKAFQTQNNGALPILSALATGPAGDMLPPSIAGMRASLAAARAAAAAGGGGPGEPRQLVPGVSVPASMDGVEKLAIEIPVRDGARINAIVYRPCVGTVVGDGSPGGGGSPLFVAIHAGGWCVGMPEMEEVNCVNAVQKFGAVAVNIDYRLAPEHPFPTPINDCWDALNWIAANATTSPVLAPADPSKGFIVHGESAGGNMAIVLALLARDAGLAPPLTGVSLCIPPTLPPGGAADALPERFRHEYVSDEQNKDGPILDTGATDLFMENYKPDPVSPLFAPFNWPTGHKGLPPVFFQVCGMDTLRDDALLYERLLRTECGVKTRLVVYAGLPHSFWSFFPQFEASKKAVREVVDGFGWLLGKA